MYQIVAPLTSPPQPAPGAPRPVTPTRAAAAWLLRARDHRSGTVLQRPFPDRAAATAHAGRGVTTGSIKVANRFRDAVQRLTCKRRPLTYPPATPATPPRPPAAIATRPARTRR